VRVSTDHAAARAAAEILGITVEGSTRLGGSWWQIVARTAEYCGMGISDGSINENSTVNDLVRELGPPYSSNWNAETGLINPVPSNVGPECRSFEVLEDHQEGDVRIQVMRENTEF